MRDCGAPDPASVKFCGECGTALVFIEHKRSTADAVAPVAERRLVSVPVTDLVGLTTASEGRDAEDTRELLTRWFDTCRTVIERHGVRLGVDTHRTLHRERY